MAGGQRRGDHLVTGVGGAQGGAIARHLLAQGHRVRGLVRSDAGARRMPEGVAPFAADLDDPAALATAFAGVTHAALHLPLDFDPAAVDRRVENLVAAARAAGVERIVFNTGNRIPGAPAGTAAFETRSAAAAALLASGVPTTVLRPPVYLDNLRAPWVSGPLVANGVLRYPLPAALPMPWLGHDDLARATAAALHHPDLGGRTLDIGGAALTGPQLADAFAAVLHRTVRYRAQKPADFEAALATSVGPQAAAGVAATYHRAASDPGLYDADPEPANRALGLRPVPVREWIAAQPWRTLSAAAR